MQDAPINTRQTFFANFLAKKQKNTDSYFFHKEGI